MDFEKGLGDLALEIIASEDEVIPESVGGNLSYFNSSTENEFDIRKIKVTEEETNMIIEQVMGCPTTVGTIGVNTGGTIVGKKKKKKKIKEQGKDHIAKDLNLFYKLKSKKLSYTKRKSMVNDLIKRDKKLGEEMSYAARLYRKLYRKNQKKFARGKQIDPKPITKANQEIPRKVTRARARLNGGHHSKSQTRFLRGVDKIRKKRMGDGIFESYSHIKALLEGSFGIKRLERVRNAKRRKGQDFKSSEKRFQAKAYPEGKNFEKLARNKLVKYTKIKEGSQSKKRFLRIIKKLGDKGQGDTWINVSRNFLGSKPSKIQKLKLKADKLSKSRKASWNRRSIPSREGAEFEFRQKRRAQGYKTDDV